MKQSRPKQNGYGWPQSLTQIWRMMKLATLFLFLGCLQVSATAYSQKTSITLSLNDVSLEQVFNEITQESGYLFLYNNEKLTQVRDDVSVTVKDATIEQVVDVCLKGLPLSYEIMDRTIVITPDSTVPKQQVVPQGLPDKEITGTVVDSATGNPIVGATVKVQGKSKGTVTDVDGKFELEVEDDAVLEVSYLGYGTKILSVSGKDNFIISLSATATGLNQLVVVGYGTQKRSDITGSLDVINAEDFQRGAITSPEQMLTGKAAGVYIVSNGGQPGTGSKIRIRGGASLNANNSPLIVLDGVPLESAGISGASNPLSFINSHNIASFTILKDASATAIYGSRASNGVIIITTKKGSSGELKVHFSTVNSISSIPKYYNVLSTDQFRKVVNEHGTADQIAALGKFNTDWQKKIYQNGFNTDNNISISGGIKGLPYRLSLGYQKQTGILRTDEYQKTSASLTLTPSFFDDHLRVSLKLTGAIQKTR